MAKDTKRLLVVLPRDDIEVSIIVSPAVDAIFLTDLDLFLAKTAPNTPNKVMLAGVLAGATFTGIPIHKVFPITKETPK